VALLCNQASIDAAGRHILEILIPGHGKNEFRIACVFGPQHGIWGHTQDDMIEWEGFEDPRTGLRFHSLYGERREPAPEWLEGVDLVVCDLPDVGSRYYTFLWTMALCMKASERAGIVFLVLDRPNPIRGDRVEGTVLDQAYASFVGLHPLPMRHGMTLGEVARSLQTRFYPNLALEIVPVQGWQRHVGFRETGLLWAMPSPNMPSPDTALVYPGMCLLEGTNLSEGRGTTRPFETFGAPFADGQEWAVRLNSLALPGAFFRPVQFQPTFQKHADAICGGAFLHVHDAASFEPVLTAVAVMQEALNLFGERFQWKPPPYEYETEKLPFDILAGNSWLREAIEDGVELGVIRERMATECSEFEPERQSALLYR